jgi:hypothetical protein
MNYHAPTDQFTFGLPDIKRASFILLHAIRKIRDGANLDLKGYDYLGRVCDWASIAENDILEAAGSLGIDLGASRPGKLDVSDL